MSGVGKKFMLSRNIWTFSHRQQPGVSVMEECVEWPERDTEGRRRDTGQAWVTMCNDDCGHSKQLSCPGAHPVTRVAHSGTDRGEGVS